MKATAGLNGLFVTPSRHGETKDVGAKIAFAAAEVGAYRLI
jgi:hypothetical protein